MMTSSLSFVVFLQVPAELRGHGPFGDAREYVWVPTGLNDHWRISKYHPGDQFQVHCDASFAKSDTEESKFTVNVYMNDGFDGGATRFYHGRGGDCAFAVTPETGMGCIFAQPTADRNYYHDGERVRGGVKYLFRTDVMYRQTATPYSA